MAADISGSRTGSRPHQIAPQASIHLVRVLNTYGVGDVGALLAGLALAQEIGGDGPLVINCSLTLAIPPGQERDLAGVRAPQRANAPAAAVHPPMVFCQRLVSPVAGASRTIIVGAAGNDSRATVNGMHRQAGYPAAIDSVVGVTALGTDDRPASFSNRADSNIYAALARHADLATFGGDWELAGTGVLGVFTADYFSNWGGRNTNGWAYWSGTSFAAPIISGILALGLSCGLAADAALHELLTATKSSTPAPDTAVGEALDIQQG